MTHHQDGHGMWRWTILAQRRAEMRQMATNGHSRQAIADHYAITTSAVSQQLAKATTDEDSPVMAPWEVAHLAGVQRHTVTTWARAGLLPSFRTPGGHYRFHRAAIEPFLATWRNQ